MVYTISCGYYVITQGNLTIGGERKGERGRGREREREGGREVERERERVLSDITYRLLKLIMKLVHHQKYCP